jgi:hypothetical protein
MLGRGRPTVNTRRARRGGSPASPARGSRTPRQTEGFDVERLSDDVAWRNQRNLDSTLLPVPDVEAPISE